MGFLTGKAGKSESESHSVSGNHAYDWAKSTFGPSAGASYNGSTNMLGNLLGLNGSGASGQAVKDYWNSAGGKFLLDNGLDAIGSKFQSMGLSKSGAAMKAMEGFRADNASTYLNNYLGQLNNLGSLGLGGGGLVVDAGQYSKSDSKSKSTGGTEGLGGLIGSIISAAAMASDIALKDNLELVGELSDGLKVYDYDYRRDLDPSLPEGRRRGVMAQDVAILRPWALGPVRPDGFLTVNYSTLGEHS